MIRTLLLAVALFAAAPALAEAPMTKTATPVPTLAPSAKMAPEAQRLDLNTASVQQLSEVEGFNKAIAESIVKARPFKNVDELMTKKIVAREVLAHVKDRLIVR